MVLKYVDSGTGDLLFHLFGAFGDLYIYIYGSIYSHYLLESSVRSGRTASSSACSATSWNPQGWNVFDFMCLLISGIELSISYFLMGGDSSEGGGQEAKE